MKSFLFAIVVLLISAVGLIAQDVPDGMPQASVDLTTPEGLRTVNGQWKYSDTRIIIQDPSIGREEITGLFASNDPVGFARAAALSLDLKATVGPNEVRISRN